MKNAAINGLIGGIVLIALNLIIGAISPKLNYHVGYAMLSSSIIYLIFMFRTNSQEKKSTTAAFGFGEALIPAMVCFAIITLLYTIFNYFYLNMNPGELILMQEAQVDFMESTLRFGGAGEDEILQRLDEFEDEVIPNTISIYTNVIGWVGSLIFPGLLLAAIIAGITRNKIKAV